MNKQVKIRNRILDIPLLQGGMGVGVSMGNLAGAVAACGGLGCISTADAGYKLEEFRKNSFAANLKGIESEIKRAKEISGGKGMIAVNAMVATRQFEDAVKTAVAAGVDAIVSGAGLPLKLPEYVGEADVAICPIVSSGRAAKVVLEYWKKHYNRAADFVVIEGPRAGGHLGFAEEDLLEGKCASLDEILPDVLAEIKKYEEYFNCEIPVFVAGGIFDKEDFEHYMQAGAAGCQMATRFIATYECDGSEEYKKVILAAKDSDVKIIHSPVGMPGRAIYTPLIKSLEEKGRLPITKCAACIKSCKKMDGIYCITDALINAVGGNYEEGLFFCGDNVGRVNEMKHVSEIIEELFGE